MKKQIKFRCDEWSMGKVISNLCPVSQPGATGKALCCYTCPDWPACFIEFQKREESRKDYFCPRWPGNVFCHGYDLKNLSKLDLFLLLAGKAGFTHED
jgi:hypothetical protein